MPGPGSQVGFGRMREPPFPSHRLVIVITVREWQDAEILFLQPRYVCMVTME